MTTPRPITVTKREKPTLPETCPVCGDGYSLTPDEKREDGAVARVFDCGAFYDRCPRQSTPTTDAYVFDDEDIHDD